ncbi:preprotein translocase subunit YajC [Gordonia sp. DT30]|uniref:preprotein translocase subunit YajC n=1 Tax=unclassified Gordonia (in: high G+C Gram-positive bacteria) TaxID=2657482 RepID=UPI003CEEFBB0
MQSLFIPLLLILMVGFMFFSMRKQKRRAAETQNMQNSVQTGTRIQLSSGLFGTVIDASSSDYLDVEIATGLVTRWNRLAIMRVIPTDEAAATYPGYTPPFSADEFSADDHSSDTSIEPAHGVGGPEEITPQDIASDRPNLDKPGTEQPGNSEK